MTSSLPWLQRLDLPPDDTHVPDDDIATFEAGGLSGDQPSIEDLLNVKPYAGALARFVLHPETEPLVIGIHGPWGKGKSTFMGFIRRSLEEDRDDDFPDVVTVEFNAWRFQDAKETWAGLASVITESIERRMGVWRTVKVRLRHAWRKNRSELLALAGSIGLAVLAAASLFAIPNFWTALAARGVLGTLGQGGAAIGGVLGAGLLLWRIPHLLQPIGQRILEYGQLPSYRDSMGYQHLVLSDIQEIFRVWSEGKRPKPKVVVFIDDLDRCSSDKIVEILQAINLILGSSQFYVFVGVASDMLIQAIKVHYSRSGSTLDEDFPRRYLEKIIQLSFRIPQSRPEDQNPLIENLFSEDSQKRLRGAEQEVIDQGAERKVGGARDGLFLVDLDAILDVNEESEAPLGSVVRDTEHELAAFLKLHRFLDDNPRVKKQVVNVHRLVKILLQGEGASWTPEQQEQLVRWLVFCEQWPREANELIRLATEDKEIPDVHRHQWPALLDDAPNDGSLQDFSRTAPPIPSSALLLGATLQRAAEISSMARSDVDENLTEPKA